MEANIYLDDNPSILESTMKEMRQRLGYDEDDTTHDKEILKMDPGDFLNEYLNWHGLIGYYDMIVNAIYIAYGVSLEDWPFERSIEREIENFEW
jgi:hypothetical protein